MKAKTPTNDSASPVNEPLEKTDKRAWELCRSGEYYSFAGENNSPPMKGRNYLDTTYLQVKPEELLKVASSLASLGKSAKDTIADAYALITEAHFFCRNLERWNLKVRRGHVSKNVARLVEKAQSLKRDGLIFEALKSIGREMNSTDALRLFNAWISEEIRSEDFMRCEAYNTLASGRPNDFNPRWLNYPEKTEPATNAPRQKLEGEHETAPWWTTADVWWPKVSADAIKRERDSHFEVDPSNPKSRTLCFRSRHQAAKLLESFLDWVQESESESPKLKRSRNKKTGVFVSPRTKGEVKDDKG